MASIIASKVYLLVGEELLCSAILTLGKPRDFTCTMRKLEVVALLCCLIAYVYCDAFLEIYAKSVSNGKVTNLGTIKYSPELPEADFLKNNLSLVHDDYCITTADTPCFAYYPLSTTGLLNKQFVLYLNNNASIHHISLLPSSTSEPRPLIVALEKSPSPIRELPKSEKKEPIKEKEEKEEKEEPKSFLQKYWPYIVGALLLLPMLIGEEPSK